MTLVPGMPKSALLPTPYVVKNKTDFWEFAKSRVSYRIQSQHNEFIKTVFNDNHNSTGSFVLNGTVYDDMPSVIYYYEISINLSALPGQYMDLIPYIIEHEIYESWIYIKRGFRFDMHIKSNGPHLLAKRHEYRLLMNNNLLMLRLNHDRFFGSIGRKESMDTFTAVIQYGEIIRYQYNKNGKY